ncbi:hypothetical protein ACKKBF_B35280 [Auxenochlorella protothecoides x Auxenochlorella symbiontica]
MRAGIFDRKGAPIAFASSPYSTTYPQSSWAEQDPEEWWRAMGEASRAALAAAKVKPHQIEALSLDTTNCTVVALDAAGKALRPCLLWMDMRSAAQAARVAASGDSALIVNGGGKGPVSAEWMVPKALWLKEEEPEVYAAATYICEYQDFINFRLTGCMCASVNNVSARWHYDTQRGWPDTLLQHLGMPELLEKWPQDVLPLAEVVGGLTQEAAEHLGLAPGTPVAQGGVDAQIGMLGLGVIDPGSLALLMGSSHLHLGVTDQMLHGSGMFGTYRDGLCPGISVVEGGQTSTGSAVAWLHRLLGSPGYAELDKEAAGVPPGAEGLVCLDHFQGNRTPHTDAASRGAFVGLTLRHSRGHMHRALLESICFGTELVLETMRDNGFHPASITCAGGPTRSDLWLQLHADISNIPLRLTEVAEAPALGSAILAAVAAGWYPSIPDAVRGMVHIARTVQPNPAVHEAYRESYAAYKELYPALRPTFHAAAARDSARRQAQKGARASA